MLHRPAGRRQADEVGQGRHLSERLSADTLARRAATTADRVGALVEIGVLHPDAAGRFDAADVQRIHVAEAYERGGIGLDDLAQAIRLGRLSFEFTDRIYPQPSPLSGRTLADLMAELGPVGALLPDLFLAFGLPQPTPDRALTEADEATITSFVQAWTADPLAAGAMIRAARIIGDATRRAAEGWVRLFVEAVALPPEENAALTMDELGPRLFDPAIGVAGVFEPSVVWLLRRHLVQALNDGNVEAMERSLELEGVRPKSDAEPPAIVFADLSGFTHLTEELGDDTAVRSAEELAHLAVGIAVAHGGRLVKQLGDGVMLAFDSASAAADAALELRSAAARARLPALHIGVSSGPVIERDGDYFGRTVNLASRLSGVAAPGEIVVNEAAAASLDRLGSGRTVPLGPTIVKGLATAIQAFRLEGTQDT